MKYLRMSRAAGLVALATTGTVLVGTSPASADITVDSAICLQNASGTLTSANPVVQAPDHPYYAWSATLPYTQCSQSNGHLYLVRPGTGTQTQVPNSGHGVSGLLFERGREVIILRVKTSLGSRDLASITLTIV